MRELLANGEILEGEIRTTHSTGVTHSWCSTMGQLALEPRPAAAQRRSAIARNLRSTAISAIPGSPAPAGLIELQPVRTAAQEATVTAIRTPLLAPPVDAIVASNGAFGSTSDITQVARICCR